MDEVSLESKGYKGRHIRVSFFSLHNPVLKLDYMHIPEWDEIQNDIIKSMISMNIKDMPDSIAVVYFDVYSKNNSQYKVLAGHKFINNEDTKKIWNLYITKKKDK